MQKPVIRRLPDHDRPQGRKSIYQMRNRFFLGGVLFSMLLLFGILGYNLFRTYQTARNNVIELSKNSSMQNAEDIELFFLRHEDVLLTTADVLEYSLEKENTGIDEVQDLLHKISIDYNNTVYSKYAGKEFTGIYAAVDGVLVHGIKTPEDLPEGYDPRTRPWYQEAVAGKGDVIFGEPYQDIYTSYTVMTATKLLEDGKTVVAMDITLDDLQFAGGNMDVSVTLNGREHIYGYGFVLTNRGVVVAHRDEAEQGACYDDPRSPMYGVFRQIKACAEQGTTYFEKNIDGVNYGIFPRKLSNGWYVVTLTDLEDIRASISDASLLIIVGTAVVTLIALVYCILITQAYIKAEKLSANLIDALALAKKDGLTGYKNRTAYDIYTRELEAKLGTAEDKSFALVMMDLNDLKYINDQYGHATGDQYICNSCALVCSIITSELYRIGGDEFAMFLTDEAFEEKDELCRRLQQTVAEANMTLVPDVDKPSIAIGMATHIAGNDDSMDALVRKADAEMYANKAAIKKTQLRNSERGYAAELKNKLLDKQMLSFDLHNAIETEQLEVWLQPQVNHARGGALIGAEALVRWRHPERGMISPDVFIPILEHNGLIYELDKYVWKRACGYIRHWMDSETELLPISVNVSRMDIVQADFIETIISIVEEQGIPYDLLHLEITESAFADDAGAVIEKVKELIRRGFIIAIDDFGSGYSTLSMLRSVPAHVLKLDLRFFAGQEDAVRNECIVESIIRMGKMLGMAVLAEGVENVEQANLLQTLGCDYIQGYFYAKALPYADYMEYANKVKSERAHVSHMKSHEEREAEEAQSQTLFRNIVSGTNDLIIVADIKTKQLLYANRAAERYYKKRFDPMIVTTCSQFCDRTDLCENCPAQGLQVDERRELVLSDGGSHMKALYTRMDWNGHDALVFYQTDISAEMREMELADSLKRNIPVAMVIMESDEGGKMRFSYINARAQAIFSQTGIKKELPELEECFRSIHPDDIARTQAGARAAFVEKRSIHEEFRVVTEGGGVIWLDYAINPVADKNGRYKFYGIYSDITDRKNAAARADAMVQNLPAALTVFSDGENGQERIFLSDSAKRILGCSDDNRRRVDLDTAYERIHPEDKQRVYNNGAYCVEHKVPVSSQFRVKGEDGKYRWVQLDTTPIMSDTGAYLYYGVYTDLNAQKQLESDVRDYELNQHNSLMNNLGVSIVIFRGDTPDELIPVFCNHAYAKLSGLHYEEFQSLLTKDFLYGVHPDDIEEARAKFREAFHANRPMQHRMRVKKPDDKYEWVTVHANITHIETGGFEAYMIISDAEEEMRKLAVDARRYENFIERTRQNAEESLSVLHLNLTKDACHSIFRNVTVNRPAVLEGGIDSFVASVADNVASEEIKAAFIEKFSREALLASFEKGVFADEMQLPVRLVDKRVIWCYQNISISENPLTGDIEAIMALTEANRDIRLAEDYKRLIHADYEIVGNIDAQTGLITVISEPNPRDLPDISHGAVAYMESLALRLRALVRDASVDACIEALHLDTLIEKLASQDIYTCSFPAKPSLLGHEGVFQWRFCYVDGSKTEILFSRREL